jgi:hypothetical protein
MGIYILIIPQIKALYFVTKIYSLLILWWEGSQIHERVLIIGDELREITELLISFRF